MWVLVKSTHYIYQGKLSPCKESCPHSEYLRGFCFKGSIIMAVKKKVFYWLKLKTEFMTGDVVDFLMSQKDGANYVVLYEMLCIKTINTKGRLATAIGEVMIPFDVDKIQRECKWFSRDTIVVAMELYKKLGLIAEQQDGIIVISDFDGLVGNETYWARQKKLANAKKKESEEESVQDSVGNSLENFQLPLNSISNSNTINYNNSLSLEEVDSLDNHSSVNKRKKFIKPTIEDIKDYCKERNNNVNAERFYNYYESNGWKVGKNSMKDWKAAVRYWENNNNNGGNVTTDSTQPYSPYDDILKLTNI